MKSSAITEFYALAEHNPIIRSSYDLWETKQLSLEQVLELAVVELVKTCNNFAEQLPSSYSASFDGCIDYSKQISDNVKYSLSEKCVIWLNITRRYLTCL